MAITKRPQTPKTPETSVEDFISSAPDAQKKQGPRKGVMRGNREQISHTIPPTLLERVDALAKAKDMTRAGLINLAISEYCQAQEAKK